ncbi:MAG: hypothetical protein V7L11_33000 [Nostoc sp.]|uniref:hypothetical protein n=1 Tax=Nostoc sp. TaxID=1180 RepID=UPI002FF8225F
MATIAVPHRKKGAINRSGAKGSRDALSFSCMGLLMPLFNKRKNCFTQSYRIMYFCDRIASWREGNNTQVL